MFYSWEIPKFRACINASEQEYRFGDFIYARQKCVLGHQADPGTCISPASELAYYPPARIFGAPSDPKCLQEVMVNAHPVALPAVSWHRLVRARVISQVAAIDENGFLYSPGIVRTEDDLLIAIARNKQNRDGYVLERLDNGEVYAYHGCARYPRERTGIGVLLQNSEPGNYGQFTFCVLPQLIFLKESGQRFDYLINADRSPWISAAVRELGLPETPIMTVREVCGDRFDVLLKFNDFHAGGMMRPSIIGALKKLAMRLAESTATTRFPERLYVSRCLNRISRPKYRNLSNESVEVEPYMAGRGFYTFEPEALTWQAQIKLFYHAKYIAGPSGSGMLNGVFSPPGSGVLDIESFHVTVRQHARIYASTQKKYSFAFGRIDPTDNNPTVAFRSWSVPLDIVADGVDWLLRQ